MTEAETIAADPKFEFMSELEMWVGNRCLDVATAQVDIFGAIRRIIRVTLAHKDLNDGQD